MNNVYKFLPTERLSYLSDELLRFTQPFALNDPFECLPAISDSIIRALIIESNSQPFPKIELPDWFTRKEKRARIRAAHKHVRRMDSIRLNEPDRYRQAFYRQLRLAQENVGIFSVSRRWNSSLMWAHYANSHSGICVGFDRLHSFFVRDNQITKSFMPLTAVKYSENRAQVTDTSHNINAMIENLTTKSIDWAYEEEERLIITSNQAACTNRATIGAPVFLFKVPHTAITEIILGANSSTETTNCTREFAAKLGIPLYQCKTSNSSFNLDRTQI